MSEIQPVETGKSTLSPDMKRFLFLVLSVALGTVAYLLPVTTSETAHRALGVTIFMLTMFVTEPVPLGVTGLLGCLLFWMWAGIPLPKAFSGFTNDTPWFILGVLLLGIMAERTGLAKRVAYNIICRLGTSYSKILAGMMIVNFLLTFLVPSGVAKTLVLCTIAIGMIETYGMAKGSNIGKSLILAMTYQSGLFDKMIIAGAASILARGLIESVGKVHVSWSLWLIAFLPIALLNIVACWWLMLKLFPPEKKTLEGGAEYCRAELTKMGRMSADEVKACVIMAIATIMWATDIFHHISPSKIGITAGLVACLPVIGALKKDDFNKANFPIVIFIAGAMCLGNVMSETEILKNLTAATFQFMTPIIHAGSWFAGLFLYWYANLFHLFLANEPSMIAATMPSLMQFSIKNGFNPLAMGMVWAFAAEGKVFIYQSAVLAVGYAFGYFTTRDLFKFGLCLFFVESLLILVIIPIWWPLLGLTFR
jgi:solute carrier family 13 (sodium-dependent dicarboxylate transporter), member 2/3/5